MGERIVGMEVKEFIQTLRDPRMRGVILLMPIIQSLVFGYAVTTEVTQVKTVVFDSDRTMASRTLLYEFTSSDYFRVVRHVQDETEAREQIDRDRADVILHVPQGFADASRGARRAAIQVLIDGTNSNTAGIIMDYVARITSRINQRILVERLRDVGSGSSRVGQVELTSRAWFNGNLESRWYYVPGVIALIVMLITLMLGSMAVVREKERGTMEQILVSPIRRFEFILGKTIPFAVIGFFDVFVIAAIALWWFSIPLRGSFLLLLLATGFFLLSTLGLGLLISTVSGTQQQAMVGTFFVYFPAVLLSGFMFPIANMPVLVRWFTYFNPLRYVLVIIRGIFLKGVGVGVLWAPLSLLLLLGVVFMTAAINRMQQTLS